MLKPGRMAKAAIVGPAPHIDAVVGALHSLGVAHIIDFAPGESGQGFSMGAPSAGSAEASERLVKIRSGARALEIKEDDRAPEGSMPDDEAGREITALLPGLEEDIHCATEQKNIAEQGVKDAEERIASLRPYAALGLPLEAYAPYKSVSIYTGTVADPKGLRQRIEARGIDGELFVAAGEKSATALFVPAERAADAEKALSECGFAPIPLPKGSGSPSALLSREQESLSAAKERLAAAKAEIIALRKKHMAFIIRSEEHLTIEAQKKEAPVRFACGKYSFVIECWMPVKDVQRVKEALSSQFGDDVYFEAQEPAHDDEPPTALQNPKPVRPFEFLLDMYSVPSYREIDPSVILALIFPLFFGFMIGDIGYGILLFVTGLVFMKKFKDSPGMYAIGWYITIAGVFAAVFGLFLFGDMFGLSFMPPPEAGGHEGGAVHTWSSLLGIDIPIPSRIHKIESSGVTQLLVISIVAGFIHLTLGLLFGIANDIKHDKCHAASKAGLLCVVTGLTFVIFSLADGTVANWLGFMRGTPLWESAIRPLHMGISVSGIPLPYSSAALLGGGIAILLGSLGGFGMLEFLEATGHLISYTRLAAICVAKGAMAFAFNAIGLQLILSGNIVFGVLGVVVVIFLQLLVFILGSLSSGIQALRLHYVEFFMKFYKGGGVKFAPFGYARRYTKEAAAKG